MGPGGFRYALAHETVVKLVSNTFLQKMTYVGGVGVYISQMPHFLLMISAVHILQHTHIQRYTTSIAMRITVYNTKSQDSSDSQAPAPLCTQ